MTIRDERLGSGGRLHVWEVERVFAGEIPSRLNSTSEACFGTHYEIGERYLVSSSRLRDGDHAWTAAYRLLPGGRVELQRWWPPGYPKELRARTLAAALAIVASGAVPSTGAADLAPTTGHDGPLLPRLAGLVGGLGTLVVSDGDHPVASLRHAEHPCDASVLDDADDQDDRTPGPDHGVHTRQGARTATPKGSQDDDRPA